MAPGALSSRVTTSSEAGDSGKCADQAWRSRTGVGGAEALVEVRGDPQVSRLMSPPSVWG